MIIAIASDHAGFRIKKELVEMLSQEYKVIDFGTFSEASCDYPDYAKKVALAVKNKQADRGIILCGSGEGVCIVANKFKGIIAGVCYSEEVAALLSSHNFANVICFPTRVKLEKEINSEILYRWTKIWISTPNSTEERHIRRINKIKEIEEENFK
ncbi:MAG: RpiB/LacA/LacB family sugar-phosphate isomerase [Elusimicrobiota bacterium]|nr:RpiB/LacA/LacB family sugar-phosphate isomerase [Endomicrobiia bacterium]MDW8165170.1 RpiB/LacA/LacB family sugar-phosphate isomerase [Elusimicrobiota bacterium]